MEMLLINIDGPLNFFPVKVCSNNVLICHYQCFPPKELLQICVVIFIHMIILVCKIHVISVGSFDNILSSDTSTYDDILNAMISTVKSLI